MKLSLSTHLASLGLIIPLSAGMRADKPSKLCPPAIPPLLQPHYRFKCPVPIDDTTQSSPLSLSPWTHHPLCVDAADVPTNKFCVYTNAQHGIAGVSIITRPQNAAEATKVLDEPIAPAYASHLLSDGAPELELPYTIVDIPDKGKGVVATRNIVKHEPIMADYASLVVDMNFPGSVQRLKGYKLLHQATDQLSNPDRVLTLGRSNDMAADEIEDVLRTNAFHTVLAGEPHMILYPDVSRINHACNPNAYTRFIPESLAVTVAAARDIQLGEEISISYITFGKIYSDRQESLRRWNFNCTCSLCSVTEKDRAASDKRRTDMESLRDQAGEAFRAGKATEAIRFTIEALELQRKEHLFPLYSQQYENLARIYWAVGDWKMSTKYARMSLDLLTEQGYIEGYDEPHLAMLLKTFDL